MEGVVRESFGDDCFDPILAQSPDQRVRDGNFPQSVDGGSSLNDALLREDCKPPALTPKFDQLRVCDGARRFA